MSEKNKDTDLKIISVTLLIFSFGFIFKSFEKFNLGEIEFAIFGLLSGLAFVFVGIYMFVRASKTRKEHIKEIKEAHKNDDLTGILNRLSFQEVTDKVYFEMKNDENRKRLYYMTIGLDRFKQVNESFGHKYADQILIEVANNLTKTLDEGDYVGRLEGDCFAILTEKSEHEIGKMISKVSKVFNKIYEPENFSEDIYLSAKMGVAAWSRVMDETTEDVVRKSKYALDVAKKEGGAFYKMYNKMLETENKQNLELEKDFRAAVELGEIDVFFQPKIGINGKIESAEALARWYSKKRQQMINPGVFIEMAEELGLIEEVGRQIMEKSVLELKKWHNKGFKNMCVAVNVSTRQFNRELPVFIKATIEKYKIKPSKLEIEVTESALVNDKNTGTDLLVRIKNTGVSIAIDDFGTGYSSLSYLLDFPLDVVKIDKSFIDNLDEDHPEKKQKGEAVVTTVINLSHKLGCKVVAEGVENEKQVAFLHNEKCDLIQGYYYSRPLNRDDFLDFLEKNY